MRRLMASTTDRWKVLVSDPVASECVQAFAGADGFAVDYRPGQKPEVLLEIVSAYDGLIVRSETKVTAEVLERAARLRAVVRAGVGVDNIDVDAATRRGVLVMNCPEGNTVAAAEHTIAMMLALARNIPQACAGLKAGRWERTRFVGAEIEGKTLGILGLGKVGREVARRGAGLGMTVVGYDPFLSEEGARAVGFKAEIAASKEEVLRRADFLTLHVPLTDQTQGLIGAAELEAAKDGVRVLNIARGGVVDEAALADAIRRGKVAGAALDVFETEPPPASHPLLGLERVVVTPHLGASTREAQEAVGKASALQLVAYLRDGTVQNAVNMVAVEPALLKKVGPWQELAERLGSLHAQLREGRVRRVVVSYAGDLFGAAERKILSLAFLKGLLSHYIAAPVNLVNASHFAREHGIDLVEQTSSQTEGFLNLVSAIVETTQRARRVAGTIFGEKHPRIVYLDDYLTDAYPGGDMIVCSNDDRPGMMGKIGTILGDGNVNIASMSMGRDLRGGTAVAILNVDSPVLPAIVRRLEGQPGILWAKTLKL